MLLTHVKEALLAAAAVAVISRILYLRRTRRQTSLKQEVAIFEQRVRQLHAAGSHARAPCLLDAVPRLAHHFAIGSFSLVQADMERALSPDDASAILASLTAAGVRRAFAVRREVVHFKKACLLVLQDVLRLERGMVRQTTFFYRELRRCGDIDGHECSACRAWRDGRRHELDHCLRGNALAPAGGSTDDDYLQVSEWLHSLRGLRFALQDMRQLVKTLCLLPRCIVSDEEIPAALRDMSAGLAASGLVARAAADAASFGAEACSAVCGEGASSDAIGLSSQVMLRALDGPTAQLPASLPAHITHYVRQSLFARGLPKAVAQAEGAVLLAHALRRLQTQTVDTLAALDRCDVASSASSSTANGDDACGNLAASKSRACDEEGGSELAAADRALVAALRRAMKLGRPIRTLRTLIRSNAPLLATLEHITRRSATAAAQPAFVASDAARGQHAMWFPPSFAPVLAVLREHAEAHDRFEVRMRDAMVEEGWPPPESTRRTRVNEGGALACRVCAYDFSRLWQERGVCWRCERRLRADGRCPFGVPLPKQAMRNSRVEAKRREKKGKTSMADAPQPTNARKVDAPPADGAAEASAESKAAEGKAAAHPFCTHQSLCAACDAGFESCLECRLAQGDGEVVLSACEEWKPAKLFLDFDRTLCSTRGGANPLLGSHTIDAELHAAAAAMGDARTHVLTRNRHAREIATFLGERGVPVAAVHTTPAGTSKWDYIDATLAPGERAVFVDDSATEVGDPRMAADPRVFRVLMQRW